MLVLNVSFLTRCVVLMGIAGFLWGENWSPPSIPSDPTKLYGDPERGSEPDPAKRSKGAHNPPVGKVTCNRGNPFADYGHFRLKKEAYGFGFSGQSFGKEEYLAAIELFEVHKHQDGSKLLYSFLEPPADAEEPKEGWPLLVSCPGSGGIGKKGLNRWHKKPGIGAFGTEYFRKNFPAYVIAFHPQARTLHYEDEGKVRTTEILEMYLEVIDEIVDRESIDRERIYIQGFSMGGSSTWSILLKRPNFFAAAAPGAGKPLWKPAEVEKVVRMPIWMFMGNQDPWSGSSYYISAFQALDHAGAERVRFWEVQDTAHSEACMRLIPLYEWLFEQRRGK